MTVRQREILAAGAEKAKAMLAVVRSGLISEIVADRDMADALMALAVGADDRPTS